MNQIFCFKRYVLLIKRQWYENASVYKWGIALMALLVMSLFGLLFWLFDKGAFNNPNMYSEWSFLGQTPTFAFTGVLFLYVYSAKFFNSLASINKKMFYLSLPVSTFERVAVAFAFVIVFMPILILIVFNVFDFIYMLLFNQIYSSSEQMFFKILAPFGSFRKMLVMILSYISYASVFTLGSLMFGKKGQVITIVFFIVYFSLYSWLKSNIFDVDNSTFIVDFMENYVFIYLLPLCWTAIYFVMKKK